MGPVLEPGRNCWRIEQAGRASVIVDACDYYHIIRQMMERAEHRILIIGWDFDPRILLDRDDSDESLGDFLLGIAKKKPNVDIRILKWDLGALKLLVRGKALAWLARLAWQKSIKFTLDHAHPAGCSHHQKIVVIDDSFAICGGIDMTGDRWDKSAHRDDEPGRVRPNGKPYGPWHDVTMAVDGPLARALAELSRDRWRRATGEELPLLDQRDDFWPDELDPHFTDARFAIARTQAAYKEWEDVREVEALFVDAIESARDFIYFENQYFTSPRIAAAIMRRMEAPDPPEIVLVTPITADGWLEQVAMDATRLRLMKIIGSVDPQDRFRIYTPKTKGGQDIYVHAKVMIVDDAFLKIGSANMNNRSLGLDSECDLALIDEEGHRACVRAVRERLMAEHLGATEAEVRATFERTGSLRATIAELTKKDDRRLEPLPYEKPEGAACFIAETELLDPKSPDAMFEGMTRRTLFDPLRGRFKALRRRGKKLPV
ncbi:phosphatidylserine/phosphatidylglycerophosphate/cardiolipin synthase-like enzyme [Sphingomonas kaistensis]|uniref:Phospholipase D n=1 Tax=Sphingomonas kaistensis TaxID=298708 RepID=A0A7X6BEN0_9SPHN|nr:phosphatidylserine/phosphatidylglycerophosphate/cardiolipin synthase-like enzyme [Sphingomonas kaistensis]